MGKFQAAPIFSDYMVLQRGKNIFIFGTGEDGTEIIGELAGFRATGVVRNGKWQLVFPPMGAARYLRLKIMDKDNDEVIRYENVAIGEVWLAAGNGAASFADGDNAQTPDCSPDAGSDIRYYAGGGWKALGESDSAVCAAFAKKLSEYHGAAVGIIAADISSSPSVAPYSLTGAIYYRDDISDVDEKSYFHGLMNAFISQRLLWNDDNISVIIGQLRLEGNISETASKIREIQMRVFRNLRKAGISILLDCGANDGTVVGERFAAQALHIVYGGYDGAVSPMVKAVVWRGELVEVQFENALGGFRMSGEPEGFEICGDDGVYKPAFADISGERIFLYAEDVPHPRGVRYMWNTDAKTFVRNGFGLPLAPFRLSADGDPDM